MAAWERGRGDPQPQEDTATAEIARSQVWQWIRHGARLDGGPAIDRGLVQRIVHEELDKIRESVGEEVYAESRAKEAQALFEVVALEEGFVEFLTFPAYDYID